MATKNDKCSFVEQIITTSDNQYSNLNLNQSEKCATLIPVQFNSKSNNATNLKVSVNYAEKQHSWIKSSTISAFKPLKEYNDDKKRWKNDKFLNPSNDSTLSLHITAYENSIETAASDLFDENNVEGLKNERFQLIKSLFEFPRQQDGDRAKIPELSKFKTSQNLLGSNHRPLNMESVLDQLSTEDDLKMIRPGDRFHRVSITTHVIRCNFSAGYKFLTCSVKSTDESERTKIFGIKAWTDSLDKLKVDTGDVAIFERLFKPKPSPSTPLSKPKSKPSTPSTSSKREYIPKSNDLQLDLFFTLNSNYTIISSLKNDPIRDLQLITGPLDKATVIVQIDRETDVIDEKFMILGKDFNTIFIELWSTTQIEAQEGSLWKFSGKIKLEGGVLLMDVTESSMFA